MRDAVQRAPRRSVGENQSAKRVAVNRAVCARHVLAKVLTDLCVRLLARLDDTIDMLMAPTHDGGYWLIGGRHTPAGVFQGIAWSTPRVARQTRAAMQSRALCWREGPPMRDIDDYRDWCAQPREQRARLLRGAIMPGLRPRLVNA